jgi:hypothetical protein
MTRLSTAERLLLAAVGVLASWAVLSLAVILIERHCGQGGLLC